MISFIVSEILPVVIISLLGLMCVGAVFIAVTTPDQDKAQTTREIPKIDLREAVMTPYEKTDWKTRENLRKDRERREERHRMVESARASIAELRRLEHEAKMDAKVERLKRGLPIGDVK